MKPDDFKKPWGRLFRVLIFCLFLFALSPMVKHFLASSKLVPLKTVTPMGAVSASAKRLEGTGLVLHPSISAPEEHILRSQLESGLQTVEIVPTWPEYVGLGLAGLFLLGCLWIGYSLACGEWDQYRAAYVCQGKLAALEAALFTYGIGALLGWVWLSPWPFLAMGGLCQLFALLANSVYEAKD